MLIRHQETGFTRPKYLDDEQLVGPHRSLREADKVIARRALFALANARSAEGQYNKEYDMDIIRRILSTTTALTQVASNRESEPTQHSEYPRCVEKTEQENSLTVRNTATLAVYPASVAAFLLGRLASHGDVEIENGYPKNEATSNCADQHWLSLIEQPRRASTEILGTKVSVAPLIERGPELCV